MARTLVYDAQEMHGMKFESHHPAMLWAIEYAGQILVRFQKSATDGMTAWERRRGRPYSRKLPKYLEPVLYLKVAPTKRRQKFEDRFETALYLGLIDRSNMVRVGDSTGCHKVNNIRRMPREQWRDQELVKSLIGTPWDPTPNTERPRALDDIPVGVALDPLVPEEELPPHLRIRAAETVPRHVKIRRGRTQEIWLFRTVSWV